jgi:putative ABC transport system permease protein
MTLLRLPLAWLRDRPLTAGLNVGLLALAVAAMTVLALFSAQLEDRLARDARGVDLVVGAKGSPLQLILSSLLHVDVPAGQVPASALERLRRDPMVRSAVPVAVGDSFRGLRVVGTEPAFAEHYGARPASGRMFARPFEAVVGAEAARAAGLGVGDRFEMSHGLTGAGLEAHEDAAFTVVGVLAPTGSVADRLMLTPVESVWAAHGHEGHADERRLTAILVSYRTPLAAIRLPALVNADPELQAAVPALEVARLTRLTGAGVEALRVLAGLLLVGAALSVFVGLYAALRQREGDLAMLRVLGAGRSAIFGLLLLEGVLLAAAGAALGLLLGHGAVAVAAARSSQLRDLGLSAATVTPAEGWILLTALAVGALAALPSAIAAYRADIAETLARA